MFGLWWVDLLVRGFDGQVIPVTLIWDTDGVFGEPEVR